MSFSDASLPTPPEPGPGPVAVAGPRSSALRRDAVTVALGVAFLAAAIVVSASRARGADLDLTVYLVGVVATIVLLGFGLAARALIGDQDTARTLMSWPLAFGTVGAGLMVGVGLDDGTSTSYVVGFLVIALAAGSYVLVPSAPPAVAGIVGVLVVYTQAFTDTVDVDVAGEDNGFKVFSVAVLVFVALVTAAAWFLPPARTTVAVLVGAGAIVAYTGIMAAIGVTAALTAGFSAGFSDLEDSPAPEPPSYDGDVYTTFAMAAVLVAAWVYLGYLTDSPGFKVLVVAMVATVFPAGILLLAVEHPTGWGVAAGVIGAAVLALVGASAVTKARSTAGPTAGSTADPAA